MAVEKATPMNQALSTSLQAASGASSSVLQTAQPNEIAISFIPGPPAELLSLRKAMIRALL
jgi:hypothetical protein